MSSALEPFFDGRTWNRKAVVDAQKARAVANAKKMGWEPMQKSFLSAPLTEAFVEEFERVHKVILPDEYRSFLLQVGDGGDGPGLYMRPLGAPFDDSEEWEEGTIHRSPDNPNELVHKSFVHTEAVHLPPHEASQHTSAGALFLFDHGCANWDLLVITGAERGRMWRDRLADEDGLTPALDSQGQPVGFARYYCDWLAEQ